MNMSRLALHWATHDPSISVGEVQRDKNTTPAWLQSADLGTYCWISVVSFLVVSRFHCPEAPWLWSWKRVIMFCHNFSPKSFLLLLINLFLNSSLKLTSHSQGPSWRWDLDPPPPISLSRMNNKVRELRGGQSLGLHIILSSFCVTIACFNVSVCFYYCVCNQ